MRWPDFWLPTDRVDAAQAMHEVWRRTDSERVEVACGGGHGRTGAALACLAVIDGTPSPGHTLVTPAWGVVQSVASAGIRQIWAMSTNRE